MARCEPRVSCINIKKISKIKNISQFGLEQNVRERERGGRKKKQASLAILQGFAGRNSIGRELKLLYTTRATLGYRNHKISSRSKVRVFTETEKRRCLGKSRYLRYGFSSTRFNFCLRACVCAQGRCCPVFPFDPMIVFWP